MNSRGLLLASAIGLCIAAPARGAAHSLAEDAAAFGVREAISAPALSPDGNEILYLTPGPGRSTVAVVANVSTGASRAVTKTDGTPEQLQWCKYVSGTRIVCRIYALADNGGTIMGGSRLVALDLDGRNVKLLGQSRSSYDAQARQFDGEVIDWMDGRNGAILMSRQYIPEEYKMNTRLVRTKSGLGVDRIDTSTLRTTSVESPHKDASGFMGDGLGNVRLMEVAGVTEAGYLIGQNAFYYRTPNSNDWRKLAVSVDDDWQPLAIDAATNRLYMLKKYNGRFALFTTTLDGAPT